VCAATYPYNYTRNLRQTRISWCMERLYVFMIYIPFFIYLSIALYYLSISTKINYCKRKLLDYDTACIRTYVHGKQMTRTLAKYCTCYPFHITEKFVIFVVDDYI